MKHVRLLLAALLICSCTSKGPSEVCDGDGECEGGLSCEEIRQGDGCAVFSSVCTTSCTTDADCSDLGDNFRCFTDCAGASLCGQAEVRTTDLPASAVCTTTSQCSDGLECLPVSQNGAESCMVVGQACSTTCVDDGDCADLGANFRCFESCEGDSVCGATG